MSHAKSTVDQSHRSRFPLKMLILTVVVAILIVLANSFVSELDDAFAVGLDIITVASMASIFLMILLWVGWFSFFSRLTWWKRIVGSVCLLALPVAFMYLFRPVNGGDANIVRYEPIWGGTAEVGEIVVAESEDSDGVDLQTETDDDYPRFLGENQNATIANRQLDADAFESAAKPVWKLPIGKGWSGFAARNEFAVTMEQRGDKECVTCYDIENGEVRWVYEHLERHRDTMNMGRTGPRSTPTIHNGLVYAVGAVGNLVCLNGNDGTVNWQKDIAQIVGAKITEGTDDEGVFHSETESGLAWGRSGAPLIVDDLVVVAGGGDKFARTTLVAFDQDSGELRWKAGDQMISYGSPVLTTLAGQRQIVYVAEAMVMGFEPETGKVLWQHARLGNSASAANTSQPTIVSGNRIVTSKGYPDGGGEVIELIRDGETLKTKSIWSDHRVLKTKLTSPVIHNGYAYSISNGFLECADLADGKRVWKRRGRFGHGQILLVGDWLLVHSELGELYLVAADPAGYRAVGSFKTIDGVCWNTLCLYGSKLLVRSELEVACFELPMLKN